MKTAVHVATVLLVGAGLATVQAQQVSLTAAPTSTTLPDGATVPMWGYSCGAVSGGVTCAAANPNAGSNWSPVIITAAPGSNLKISLKNSLTFANGNNVPTSIMIVGQLGGGLGSVGQRTTTPSPTHSTQTDATWPTVAPAAQSFTPPAQGARVQSFGTEVAAGATTTLTWNNLRPGTYLLESGTHPSIQVPMGLYGVLVVTNPATYVSGSTYQGTAYPGILYDAEASLVFGEIDPVQNNAVSAAVNTAGFSETKVWSGQSGGCGNPASASYLTCYPPVVNYTPLYYLINGVAFSKNNPSLSLFNGTPGTTYKGAGSWMLVRFVNAGSRMHIPSIVNSQTAYASSPLSSGKYPITNGMTLLAEDGNIIPGTGRVQNQVFMPAGKTYDVRIYAPAPPGSALAVYDRELSLSGNKVNRDSGMLAYIGENGATVPAVSGAAAAQANADTYNSVVPGQTLTVSDPGKGVIANDINVFGVKVQTAPGKGTLTLNPDGTFTYAANSSWAGGDSFVYCGNGASSGPACATVTLGAATLETSSNITLNSLSFTSQVATYIKIPSPGILAGAKDAAGYPLTVATSTVSGTGFATLIPDANGGFTATVAPHPGSPAVATFTFKAQNSQGIQSTQATVTVHFPAPNGPTVTVKDPKSGQILTDYRWIIEEDRTFYQDPNCTSNPPTGNCILKGAPAGFNGTGNITPVLGVNFHTSDMPYVAQGCTGTVSCESGQTMVDSNPSSPTYGQHINAVCDQGNGICRPDVSGNGKTVITPDQISLDPNKRYYISVLPADAANPFISANNGTNCSSGQNAANDATCGHSMGGAPITFAAGSAAGATPNPVTVLVEQAPFPPAKLSVDVFEDDFPLNGEQDAGGGVDALSPNEPGLDGFNIILWDDMGGPGDVTGQMTYDMFNQPLSNSLDGTIDPASGLNACPITKQGQTNPTGITGVITVCPKYESDGTTLSPLAGQAVVANLMPGRFSVQALPGADRIARGENWLQTNTLDGQKAHDSFLRIGEPAYFQEFGPAGYHVTIGFANPAIINGRLPGVCNGTDVNVTLPAPNCVNTVLGKVTLERMSRTPDERLYSSGSHDELAFTQCYISVGDPDGEDFAFTTCDKDGNFKLTGLPTGNWRLTTFDQWNDVLVDGLSTPIGLQPPAPGQNLPCPGPQTSATVCDLGDVAASQWQSNVYTRAFIDKSASGVSNSDDPGIPLINTTVRYRDGSMANNLVTDMNGVANFNETFPLFNWYVVETDTTRYKNTGTHTVYDAGGPSDGSASCFNPANPTVNAGYPQCGNSTIGHLMANTYENNPLPALLSVPGSIYCSDADCSGQSVQNVPASRTGTNPKSTGRIDNPWFGGVEGWQGFSGQSNFIEFGKEPYVTGENGGIKGHVVYASTRPFDDPQNLVQTQWEPLVPHVTMNLYKEGFAADGVTPTLTLVDTTQTSSWDDWAQGFHLGPDHTTLVPNMNCPGQTTSDLFFFSLYNQPEYLDLYSNVLHGNAAAPTTMPNNSQFKCYDGMHNWNQLQPAVYDGMYQFPSITSRDPITGKPNGTNCTICSPDPVAAPDLYAGIPMLPVGKYVVEVVPPPGYEIVKEEDKNILIGDNFIAPSSQEFGGLGDVFILPDQASVASGYNPWNGQNSTTSLGAGTNNQIVPGFVEPTWPCVGESRVVPDYISLFPQSKQVAPFAGATRHLCDRKEVTLNDQAGAIAKFYIYTSTHKASKFTGVITDDFTSEFDPFSPQFGEKFAPANMPIGLRDWTGNEIGRVYSDWWGDYDGMVYSTWEVNPPNPTGYSPNMMIFCMNDKGPIAGSTPNTQITDPLYQGQYSQFCYELPYMPGQTSYLDTPVVPTGAFSAGYNHPDCEYPNATPAVSKVDGDGSGGGPWASAPGKTMYIYALGDQTVNNYGYSGPNATSAPFNQKTITRHYGFGACGTLTNGVCSNGASVTIGGVNAPIQSWSDTSILITVPSGVTQCAVQQQAQYGGPGNGKTAANGLSFASCGQLVVTAVNNGAKVQSIDTVNITIGGKAPTYVSSNTPGTTAALGAIQQTIDAASPGDLIIVPPGTYNEMLLMWKPVRLQGVGAASSIIDANAQPAGKMDPWRRQVACLFGIAMDGAPINTISANPHLFDPTNTYQCSTQMQFAVDRLPLEAVVGWDATLNGNLAELLQEPTLMGAYEGAGITVLGKGVNFHTTDPASIWAADTYPTQTTLLSARDCNDSGTNPYPSNFQCNPSSIDGLSITDSSQGGGGIFVHGWNHNLQIANNRIYGNIGTLSGGINVGQGEFPPQNVQNSSTNAAPGSCVNNLANNVQQPYCFNLNVNVHHNSVTANSSIGDELFSGTPAGAGGVSFCTGADYYKFNYNWLCGNMSSGDGGGLAHLGFSYNGDIEHNSILFNQSLNPTIPTNGGGIVAMGTPDSDPVCGLAADADCPPGLSDGVGPNLVINANLIQGNGAEAGSGGGIRLQAVNGTELTNFPNTPSQWYSPLLTNNIIVNNVAGWDGGGLSIEDGLAVRIINNTIASNDSTATAGVLFNTLGAPLASTQSQPSLGQQMTSSTSSAPQPAGLVSEQHSIPLVAALLSLPSLTCPHDSGYPAAYQNCQQFSNPYLANNVFWQNRSFYIGVGALSNSYQQNIVTLYNSFTSPPSTPVTQASTGQCVNGSHFWDLGVRGDTAPGAHSVVVGGVTLTLAPEYSVLTNYNTSTNSALEQGSGANNTTGNPNFVSQYCNGSRTPPEFKASTFNVPPGISDATVPNPIFNLTPAATVDEGNNWINLTWGPLSLVNPVTNTAIGNYTPGQSSSVVQKIPSSETAYVNNASLLQYDFFGNSRPSANSIAKVDIGAIQSLTTNAPVFSLAGGTYTSVQTLTLTDSTPGAVIYYTYTAAGTNPVCGTSTQYTGPISINQTGVVEAIACAPGFYPSPISSKSYTYLPPAAAPFFSLAGNSSTTPFNTPQTLYLTDTTPGAVIYYTYTTNGQVPGTTVGGGTLQYNAVTGITINHAGVVEAVAIATGYSVSTVSSKHYYYVAVAAAPTINPVFGTTFVTGTNHAISLTDTSISGLPGFAMYYTTNGTNPTIGSTPYTGSFNINLANPGTVTVKAIATATGYAASTISSRTYTFEQQLTAPFFLLSNAAPVVSGTVLYFQTYSVPNVVIYYTTNGGTPRPGFPGTFAYNATTGIPINANETVSAIATSAGYVTSSQSAKAYTVK
ncbi:hypothetical protein DYQ86_24395 [Acidobacteria bacterium AB60]|nr:hypothetical protein DYQ86_24395 [Acidobacteria bacterium AB60]